jgi:hypothetical protein
MDTLSSCYFCGTALDEPLATYGVGVTEPALVTLCRGCHHKLESVFEAAGVEANALSADPIDAETSPESIDDGSDDAGEHAAVEDPDGDEQATSGGSAETDTSPDEAEDSEDEGEAEDSEVVTIIDPSNDESGSVEDDEQDASTPATPTDNGAKGESDADDTGTAEDPLAAESDASDILVDPETDDGLGSETVAETGDSTDTAGDELLETEMEAEVPDELATDEQDDEVTDDESGDDEPDESASETDSDSETASEDGDSLAARTTISALEYNKVMRLLQNREFPVDRQEIEAVATNAYDLRQSECAEVIDLAVDRGLIDEREGELHRPVEE